MPTESLETNMNMLLFHTTTLFHYSKWVKFISISSKTIHLKKYNLHSKKNIQQKYKNTKYQSQNNKLRVKHLSSQYFVCPHLATRTAWIRFGILLTSVGDLSVVSELQQSRTLLAKSRWMWCCLLFKLNLMSCHKFPMGLRYGDWGDQFSK